MAIRKPVTLLLSSFLIALASCAADLGKFDPEGDASDYYDSFGDVKGLFDGGSLTYDVEKSLYNETTLKEMTWEDEDDAVQEKEYLYLVLPFESALTIEAIVFNVYTPTNAHLEMNLFYFADPSLVDETNFKYLASPDTKTEYDEDGNPIGEVPIPYDEYADPPADIAVVSGETDIYGEEWSSIAFGDFMQPGHYDGKLYTDFGGALYIRVENNSGWRKDELQPVSFTFINLLVRAV
jgi:hypothetical protein